MRGAPKLNSDEVFEDKYTERFRSFFARKALELSFARDRAGIDIGFMLTEPASLRLSPVKVWFQLKGALSATIPREQVESSAFLPVPRISVDLLKFWYAAPEAVFLALYVESTDQFLVEDIRDLVDRQFGPDFLLGTLDHDQQTTTLKLSTSAVLTAERVDAMLRHRSIRIDGPSWRGRPLGHRLDPLRCTLSQLAPVHFEEVVQDLLLAHNFEQKEELDASELIAPQDGSGRILLGTLHSTYEWVFGSGTELGFGEDSWFRSEGQIFHVHGEVAVIVHSTVKETGRQKTPLADEDEIRRLLTRYGAEDVLVITNYSELPLHYYYRQLSANLMRSAAQGLESLSFSLLVATLVYLRHRENIEWSTVQYL